MLTLLISIAIFSLLFLIVQYSKVYCAMSAPNSSDTMSSASASASAVVSADHHSSPISEPRTRQLIPRQPQPQPPTAQQQRAWNEVHLKYQHMQQAKVASNQPNYAAAKQDSPVAQQVSYDLPLANNARQADHSPVLFGIDDDGPDQDPVDLKVTTSVNNSADTRPSTHPQPFRPLSQMSVAFPPSHQPTAFFPPSGLSRHEASLPFRPDPHQGDNHSQVYNDYAKPADTINGTNAVHPHGGEEARALVPAQAPSVPKIEYDVLTCANAMGTGMYNNSHDSRIYHQIEVDCAGRGQGLDRYNDSRSVNKADSQDGVELTMSGGRRRLTRRVPGAESDHSSGSFGTSMPLTLTRSQDAVRHLQGPPVQSTDGVGKRKRNEYDDITDHEQDNDLYDADGGATEETMFDGHKHFKQDPDSGSDEGQGSSVLENGEGQKEQVEFVPWDPMAEVIEFDAKAELVDGWNARNQSLVPFIKEFAQDILATTYDTIIFAVNLHHRLVEREKCDLEEGVKLIKEQESQQKEYRSLIINFSNEMKKAAEMLKQFGMSTAKLPAA